MMLRLIIKPYAEADVKEAVTWYQNIREGLGDDFIEALQKKIIAIQNNPDHFQLVHKSIRRALTERFPFAIFFIVESDTIYVLAILHTSRSPAHWKNRK